MASLYQCEGTPSILSGNDTIRILHEYRVTTLLVLGHISLSRPELVPRTKLFQETQALEALSKNIKIAECALALQNFCIPPVLINPASSSSPQSINKAISFDLQTRHTASYTRPVILFTMANCARCKIMHVANCPSCGSLGYVLGSAHRFICIISC